MKTAAVAIDAWKLPVFRRHLNAVPYDFTEHPGLTPGTLILRVKYTMVADLQPIIEAAEKEAQRDRRQLKREHRKTQGLPD